MIINCKLTNEGINSGCEHIRGFLENTKIPHNEVIKMTLLVEETLLQYQEFCGEDTDFSMNLYPLFNAFKIDISIKGEKLDPFSSNKDEAQLLNEQILLPLLIQEDQFLCHILFIQKWCGSIEKPRHFGIRCIAGEVVGVL